MHAIASEFLLRWLDEDWARYNTMIVKKWSELDFFVRSLQTKKSICDQNG